MKLTSAKTAIASTLLCVMLSGCLVAPAPGGAFVTTAPPVAPFEPVVGVAPGPGFFWVGGSYFWVNNRYTWRPGFWQAPRPGWRWQQHTWARGRGGWVERPGRWVR
jgi:hypothetical protein